MNYRHLLSALTLIIFLSDCSNSDKKTVEVKNGNVIIAYNEASKSDTTLLFVHGWCINKEYWKSQMDFFSKRYKVVAMDLGGHGQSGKNRSDWTIEEYAKDVIAVVNALKLDKVILVGHSMGGDIILQAANSIPGKIVGFIGIDNFKDVVTEITPEGQQGIDQFFHLMQVDYKSFAAEFCKTALFPPDYADTVSENRVIKDIQQTDTSIAIPTLRSLMVYSLKESQQLSLLKIPVHLLVSDFSPMNDSTVRKYCNKGLFIYTINGTGHYPMIEKPNEFDALLQQAIDHVGNGNSE